MIIVITLATNRHNLPKIYFLCAVLLAVFVCIACNEPFLALSLLLGSVLFCLVGIYFLKMSLSCV